MEHNKLFADDIHKSFGPIEVLKGISVRANDHDVIALLGASGSGKSTFLRCINFLECPTSGSISIAGETIATKKNKNGDLSPSDSKQILRIRSKLGMVFQSFNLWSHMTAMENVIEGPIQINGLSKADAVSKAEELLDKVGIYERKDYYPNHMSGGQQQRAAIARALAMDPEVLLFDEPTSSLDPELVGEVLKVMRGLANEGRTMIVVTHEMGFARDAATRVIFLNEGKIEEDGKPGDVMLHPESPRFKQFLSRASD
jgi:arginine/ornithine transport system ATP-binding protein